MRTSGSSLTCSGGHASSTIRSISEMPTTRPAHIPGGGQPNSLTKREQHESNHQRHLFRCGIPVQHAGLSYAETKAPASLPGHPDLQFQLYADSTRRVTSIRVLRPHLKTDCDRSRAVRGKKVCKNCDWGCTTWSKTRCSRHLDSLRASSADILIHETHCPALLGKFISS